MESNTETDSPTPNKRGRLNAREQKLVKLLVGSVILVCLLLLVKWRLTGGV